MSGYVYQCVDDAEPISDTFGEQATNSWLYNVINPEGGSCALTYDAVDLTVDLAAGQITHFGSIVAVAVAANAFTLVADTTFPRWTWLALSSAGAAVVVSGDPAAVPSVPELGDRVALALVYVQANLTIANSATYKIDKRVPGYHPAIPQFVEPMLPVQTTVVYGTRTANSAYFIPIYPVTTPMTITALNWAHNVASGNYDVGIYSWDGTTMTRVTSKGTTASPAVGAARVSSSITSTILYPGTRYFFAWACDNGTEAVSVTNALPVQISADTLGFSKVTSFPLPATVTPVVGNSPVIMFGVVSGGAAI